VNSSERLLIFSASPTVDDTEIVELLDFCGRAQERGSWAGVQVAPPFIVGSPPPSQQLPADVIESALASGVVTNSIVNDRGVRHDSFSGSGVVRIDSGLWWVTGSAAHDNRFHDQVSGAVSGHPIKAIEMERLRGLAESANESGRVMLALTLTHVAGGDISRFDSIESSDALDDLIWKMTTAGWHRITVHEVVIDSDIPIFCEVRVTTSHAPSTDWTIPSWERSGSQWVGRVPRAGMSSLNGFSMELPRS